MLARGPDPLRNTVSGIFLLILLACLIMTGTSLLGMARMERLSSHTQECTQALLMLQQLRRGERDVVLPPLEGRDALEEALLGGEPDQIERTQARYEQAALRGLLEAERMRANQLRLQAIAAGVLMVGTLLGLMGLLYWLFGVLLKPIEDLAGLARRVREGELGWRAVPVSQPELNELAQALNEMLDALHGRMEELEATRKAREAVLAGIPEAVLGLDGQQHVVLSNQAACQLAGEDWSGRSLAELPLRHGAEGEAWKGEIPAEGERLLVVRPDGARVPVFARLVKLEGQSLLCLRDLGPEERLEALRQETISMVMHELGAPARRLAELADSQHHPTLGAQARALQSLVENLRLSEDLRRGLWSTRNQAVDLGRLLEEVVESQSGPAHEKEIRLDLKPGDTRLAGDAAQLGLLFHSLVRRVVEGSKLGSRVQVSHWIQGERACVEVVPDEGELAGSLRQWLQRPPGPDDLLNPDGIGLIRQILKTHQCHLEEEPRDRVRLSLPVGQPDKAATVQPVMPEEAQSAPTVRVGCSIGEGALLTWLRRSLSRHVALCPVQEGRLDLLLLDLDAVTQEPVPSGTPVLALSERSEGRVEDFLRLGATGWITKDCSAGELRQAMQRVMDGETVLCSRTAEALRQQATRSPRALPSAYLELTAREQEIFQQITMGMSNKEIADSLVISEGTVKTHVNNMLRKLNLKDRVQILLFAAQHDLLNARADTVAASSPPSG
ncbi:MAG: LuxR C-terminal-related transcriptional regulator [Candidatus Eremiobacterota bacterium]